MTSVRLAFGPEAPAFGSWEWVGADVCRALRELGCQTSVFRETVPDCDIAMFVKFKPDAEELRRLRSQGRRLVYCPVDVYGSAADIDADAPSLACFDRIIIHSERLRKYFAPYAAVEYLDHHLKFITAAVPAVRPADGPLVWIGNRSNLPPVVAWVNHQRLPGELWVLTDVPRETDVPSAADLGFHRSAPVRIGRWTPERHVEWTGLARAAFDVKGDDFRARHKPPTKALDFLASGVPLAMNADSSSTEHLRRVYGWEIADLPDVDRWLSSEYQHEIGQLVSRLRRDLALPQIAARWLKITHQLMQA